MGEPVRSFERPVFAAFARMRAAYTPATVYRFGDTCVVIVEPGAIELCSAGWGRRMSKTKDCSGVGVPLSPAVVGAVVGAWTDVVGAGFMSDELAGAIELTFSRAPGTLTCAV